MGQYKITMTAPFRMELESDSAEEMVYALQRLIYGDRTSEPKKQPKRSWGSIRACCLLCHAQTYVTSAGNIGWHRRKGRDCPNSKQRGADDIPHGAQHREMVNRIALKEGWAS